MESPSKNIGLIIKGDLMAKAGISYRENLIKKLKGNEKFQHEYLKASLDENPDMPEAFLLALKTVADARGFSNFAQESGLNRESLYRTLSEDGNPKLDSLIKILNALDLQFSLEPKKKTGT